MRRQTILGLAVAAFAGGAVAQTHVGEDHYAGLHWAVAAPEGASWALNCRFRPVTLWMSQYNRQQWANELARQGSGPQRGRLPGDNGRCTLTKIGGRGPVGLALVKNGVATAQGANTREQPARVNVF
jgi:hypothetical protein